MATEYSLDECSYYSKYVVQGKRIYVFDKHNMALPAWGEISSKMGPLNLISFDAHTDTHPAFSAIMCDNKMSSDFDYKKIMKTPEVKRILSIMRYTRTDFSFEDVFKYSYGIWNTEQILTGVVFGYLESYTIRFHGRMYDNIDSEYGFDSEYINDEDDILPRIKNPLLLDIDLDYFRNRSEMGEEFVNYITPYFKAALAVTIAREPEYFNDGKQENDFSVDEAEKKLLDVFSSIE